MGYRLRRWMRDHMPKGFTAPERLVILEVADAARDETRECWADRDQLALWCGYSVRTVTNIIAALAVKGFDLRVVLKIDKRGMPVYAYRGHPARYRIPIAHPDVGGPFGDESPPDVGGPFGDESPPDVGGAKAAENGPPKSLRMVPQESDHTEGLTLSVKSTTQEGPATSVSLTIINGGQDMTKRSTTPGQMPLMGIVHSEPPNASVRGHPVVAGWIDYCAAAGVKLPRRLIGQYAKLIGEASAEGFDDITIKHALASMLADNVANRPSLLPARLVQAQTGVERKGRRMATTDERVADALDIARRMEEEDSRDEQG